jgi:hypothetical protein
VFTLFVCVSWPSSLTFSPEPTYFMV